MTKILAGLLVTVALLIASTGLAQVPNRTAPPIKKDSAASTPVIVPLSVGTAFNTTLIDPIDTRRARTGDVVTATVAEDVAYEQTVVFPKGTKIVGHVLRATSGGRGRTGSALFLQFDKALLDNGEEVILNAGIQALANTPAPQPADTEGIQDKPSTEAALPVDAGAEPGAPQVVSTIYDTPQRPSRDPLSPLPQGEMGADGLFSPDSRGAFGRPDVKIYTPTSDGSHGTVLVSTKKQMRLDTGARLLLVVQPPPTAGADKAAVIDVDPADQP